MTRTSVPLLALLAFVTACGEDFPREAVPVDCSVVDEYEFLNISDFNGGMTGWFYFADPTPGGIPDPNNPAGTNVDPATLEPPGRCNDTRYMQLKAEGHNFWGAGFGDWFHNAPAARANGTGYEGISLWARSPRNFEKSFLLGVDDGRTIVNGPTVPEPVPGEDPEVTRCRPLAVATAADQDLNGDGCIGPGDIASGTECRLPPSSDVGSANCYNGGVDAPPSGGARVPLANECGNQFHTWIHTTETWQLFRIPFAELVQWPCPNRLAGGIDVTDIAKFEIKTKQGMTYEIWLDNIAFYRRR